MSANHFEALHDRELLQHRRSRIAASGLVAILLVVIVSVAIAMWSIAQAGS